MTKALLIIDVQKACARNAALVSDIEKLQYTYDTVFASRFINEGSFLPRLMNWKGYDDTALAFLPAPHTFVFDKTGYSSFISELSRFDEVHLCGYDTDACVYKTALDLVEHNIRPVVLASLCDSESLKYHKQGLSLLERNIGKHNIVF